MDLNLGETFFNVLHPHRVAQSRCLFETPAIRIPTENVQKNLIISCPTPDSVPLPRSAQAES